jgi:hypothetical protein
LLATALVTAGVASGEVAQKDNVRLAFDVEFSPHALPRDRAVPVSATFSGSISAVNGAAPPRVKRLSIAFNRRGVVSAAGLPVCRQQALQSVTSEEALARCRGALLGRGHFAAHISFVPNGFQVQGPALAFNGRRGGRQVIFLHVYVTAPVQAALVLVMTVSHRAQGRFATVLSTTVPKLAGGAGYLTGIRLRLDRRYRFEGRSRSFISASCPARPGFTFSAFTLARGSFEFANGQHANVALTRTCSVRAGGRSRAAPRYSAAAASASARISSRSISSRTSQPTASPPPGSSACHSKPHSRRSIVACSSSPAISPKSLGRGAE